MKRSVYCVSTDTPFFEVQSVTFKPARGMNIVQWRKNVEKTHEIYMRSYHASKPLEVSTFSTVPEGAKLSAYRLTASNGYRTECMFQSAKTFEKGGPYADLLNVKPHDAQHDERLRKSGKLTCFTLFGKEYPLEPKTAFYDWIYIRSLMDNPELAAFVTHYDAFTDTSFNPERQVNCQAEACAIYCGMQKAGIKVPNTFEDFVKAVWG